MTLFTARYKHCHPELNGVILSVAKDLGGNMQGNRYPGQFPNQNQPRTRTWLWLLIILAIALIVGVSVFGIFYFGVFNNSGGGGLAGASPTSVPPTTEHGTPPPSGPCGINSPYGFTTIYADQQLVTLYKQLNVCWVRYQFHWDKIETKPGVYNWSLVDAAIATMNAAGIHVDFAIQSAPQWDLVQTCFGVPYLTGPTQMAQFSTIIATR